MATLDIIATWGLSAAQVTAYNRVSTKDQHNRDALTKMVYSCDRALRAIGLDPTLVKHYQDVQSGRDDDRPEFEEMRAELEAGRYRLLILYRADRLTRRLVTTAELGELFRRVNVRIYESSTDKLFDLEQRQDWHDFATLGVGAESESRSISTRTQLGLAYKFHRGAFVGHPPFGYVRGEDGVLVYDHRSLPSNPNYTYYSAAIYILKTLVDPRYSIKQAAEIANQELGLYRAPRRWREWSDRPSLRGYTTHLGAQKLTHPPLVDDELHHRLTTKSDLYVRHYGPKKNKHLNLFSGLIYCGQCGCRMNYSAYATKVSSTEINRRVYVCGSYARAKIDQPNEDRCHWRKVNGLLTKAPIVKEQDLVAPINQALMSAYELIADSLVTPIPDPDPTCIPLRAEIKDLYKLIAKYGDAGGELQSRIDRLNVEINNITLGPTPDPLREEFIAIFRSGLVLATMTPHEAAAVYRRYLDRVTIVDRKIAEIKLKVR